MIRYGKRLSVLAILSILAGVVTFLGSQQIVGGTASTDSGNGVLKSKTVGQSVITFVDSITEAKTITGIDAKELQNLPAGWARDAIIVSTTDPAPNVSQVFQHPEGRGEWFEITRYDSIRYTEGEEVTIGGKRARRSYIPPESPEDFGRLTIFFQEGIGGTLIWGRFKSKLLTEATLDSLADQLARTE